MRIRKAEEDRMAKYYKQVSELNEWRREAQDNINDNNTMLEAVANHFAIENQVYVFGKISEALLKVLDNRELNKLIDFAEE